MLWYRARNLPLHIHGLCNFAFRLPSLSSRSFYRVHLPPPPPPPPPTPPDDEPLNIKGVLQWYFAKSFKTVPYTNRTRRILYPRDIEISEREIHCKWLKEKLMENERMLLSPTHPDVIGVKMIFNNIMDVLQRDLRRMGNATSSYDSIVERILMSILRKPPPASTSHLDGMDWEVLVVNDPQLPTIPFCYSVSDGKIQQIVVSQDLVHLYDGSDIEIAAIISQQVAGVVARHEGEKLTKEMGIVILSNYLGENFAKHIGLRIISLIRRLPFNKRLDVESEYIGRLLLASAGYDPQQVAEVYEKIGREKTEYCVKS